MDLQQWLRADVAGIRSRLLDTVVALVPHERWHEQADDGGSTLAHLLLHLARHQDLAVNAVVLGRPALFLDHRDALGLVGRSCSVGLSEAEDRAATSSVEADPLLAYVTAVFDSTGEWLAADVGELDVVPDVDGALTRCGGIAESDVPWLFAMWRGRPEWWFAQWPVVGHGNAHVGEAISVRNRFGLSPF